MQFLENAARLLFFAGAGAAIIALGFLGYTYFLFMGGGAPAGAHQAISNVELFEKLLLAGLLSVSVSTAYLYWGEETLGVLQIVAAGAFFFAPIYLPMIMGGGAVPSEVCQRVLAAFQLSGIVVGIFAIGITVVDIAQRAALRSKIGSRAEQLKYGKGIKEEKSIQNVFMGKCWQLPFCRKFVRERCPIYHSRRTCWRERVGCMCEEAVIRDAMAGKTIPKDAVAAASYIPYNRELTMPQKEERCRQCVIYNEHQKHKYKLLLPVTFLAFAAIYAIGRTPMLAMMEGMLDTLDRMIGRATFQERSALTATVSQSGLPFHEILLVCLMVVLFAYALKVLEFAIFKLKI